MSSSRDRPLPSLLAPITILLPLTLLATVLLPGVGVGVGPLGTAPQPSSGGAPVQSAHPGSGFAPKDGAYVNVAIAPPSSVLVAGTSEVLSAQVSPSSDGGVVDVTSWLWSLSPGAPGYLGPLDQSSATFYAASVTTPTEALVTVDVRGFVLPLWEGEFFSVEATSSVTVVAPLTAGPISETPDPASPGEPVTLSTDVGGGSSPYSISFQLGDGASATLTSDVPGPVSVTHDYAAGNYAPTASVTDGQGTEVPTSSAGSLVVTSHLGAALLAPAVADEGAPLVVRSSVGGGAAPYSYLWSNSWGGASYATGAWTFVPGQEGPLSLQLTVTDADGQVAVAPPLTVQVVAPPALTLSSSASVADVGSAFPLTIQVTGGAGPFQLSWDPGENAGTLFTEVPSDGTYSEPYTFSMPGALSATAQVQDALGVNFGTSASVGRIVPAPSISLQSAPGVPTEGQPFSLTAMVGDGVPPYDWSWSFDGPVVSSSPMRGTLTGAGSVAWNGTLPAAEDLVAVLQVVDASGGVANGSIDLEVLAPLQVSVSAQPTRGEVGRPISAQVTLVGGQGPYSLSLSASDGETLSCAIALPGTQTFTLMPQVPGNLTVVARVSDALGHSYIAGTTVPIAPAFRALLSMNGTEIDAGGQATVVLLLQGGWGPFQGDVALSDGRVFPVQTSSTRVVLCLPFPVPGSFTVGAQATDALGSSSGSSVVVTIAPDPWVALTVGMAQSDVGAPLAFLATAGGGSGAFPTLSVNFGDGNRTGAWASTHVYARVGNYVANASLTDSVGGHASSSPVDIAVVPAPQVAAELLVPGTDAGLAAGFSSEVSFGTPPFSYRWDFGDGTVSALADPSHIFQRPGLYQVALTVTDSVGASSVAPTVNVTVSAPPALSVSANRSSLEVGAPALFQATALGGATPEQVTWSFGDGSVATGMVLVHTYTVPGTYTVVASLSDAAGGSAAMDLVVSVAPSLASVGVVSGPGAAEVGVRTLLSEVPVGGLAPYLISWALPGVQASGLGLTSWSFVPNASGPLAGSVRVTDADGLSSSVSFALSVAPALQASPHLLPSTPEAGQPFQMISGTSGGVPPYTFLWSLPPPLADPGNRTTWEASLPSPGTYPVGLVVTDAEGRSVSSSISLDVAPPLQVVLPEGGLAADAGVPFVPHATIMGGVGTVSATITTPWGTFPLASGSILFPTPGDFPVEVLATDQVGAVAVAQTNLTVSPPPVAALSLETTKVAVGASVTWSADALGGRAPYLFRWQVAGLGAWEGSSVNLTFPNPGTYGVTLTVQDAAGGSTVLRSNATAVLDDLSLGVNLTRTEGLLPFRTTLVVTVSGSAAAAAASVYLDGERSGAPQELATGLPWALPLQFDTCGTHTVEVVATDTLGATARSTFSLGAFDGLGPVQIAPDPASAQAGVPLTVSAAATPENGTWASGESVGLDWWGTGISPLGGDAASFLADRSGTTTVDLTGTVSSPDGTLLENLTLPVPIAVLAASATHLSVREGPTPLLVGSNGTVVLSAEDDYGNLNTSYSGNVTARQVAGPTEGGGDVAGSFLSGEAALTFTSTKAGTRSYILEGALAQGLLLQVSWQADASRAVLRLLSWERVGSSLLLNVSALDVYGNPLTNVTVTAEAPGGSTVSGTVVEGNVSLLLPGASGVSSLELLGPGGAQTDVVLPSGGDPASGETDLVLVAVGIGAVLAAGLLLSWQRRRSRAHRSSPKSELPSVLEAKGAIEEIIEHLPGEDRDTLLLLAEEHGIPRKEAEEALVLLEQDHRATRRTDSEGVERWDPPVPMEAGADRTGPAPEPMGELASPEGRP